MRQAKESMESSPDNDGALPGLPSATTPPKTLLGSARAAAGRITNGRKARLLRNVVVKIPPDVLAAKVRKS